MMANQDAFQRGSIQDRTLPSNQNYGAHNSPYHRPSAALPPVSSGSQMPLSGQHQFRQQPTARLVPAPSPGPSPSTFGQLPRPAIKAQYLPPMQAQTQMQVQAQPQTQIPALTPKPMPKPQREPQQIVQPPNQNSKPKTAAVFKPYKVSTWNPR
jgi:hypothetical protein